MRKVLVVLLLAGLLVLMLSVPALADSEKYFGQTHRDANWSGDQPPPDQSPPDTPPGQRDVYIWEGPAGTVVIVGNPGEWISFVVGLINDGALPIANYGEFTKNAVVP